jgi:hypothetical protein
MALTTFDTDLNIIDALPLKNIRLSTADAEAFQKKFDEGPKAIQTFINDTLIPEVEAGTIASIERTSGDGSPGTTDTYTITFQDATTQTFTIYNGADGVDGAPGATGPQGDPGPKGDTGDAFTYADFTPEQLAALTGPQGPQGPAGPQGETGPQGDPGPAGADGAPGPAGADGTSAYVHIKWGATATPATLLDTPDEYIGICSSASDTPPADYTGYTWYQWKGAKGDAGEAGSAGVDGVDGADGRGITSITRTVGDGSPGTTDTYTITYTDETTDEFTVYNGADGEGAGDMLASVYDPTGKHGDAFNADNHASGDVNKVFTALEQTKLAELEKLRLNIAVLSKSGWTADAGGRYICWPTYAAAEMLPNAISEEELVNGTYIIEVVPDALSLAECLMRGVRCEYAQKPDGITWGIRFRSMAIPSKDLSYYCYARPCGTDLTIFGSTYRIIIDSASHLTAVASLLDPDNTSVEGIMKGVDGYAEAATPSVDYALPTASEPITGYVKPETASALAATDTVNAALGKLESRLDGVDGAKQNTAITDTGNYFTTDTVEGALQEIGAQLDGLAAALEALL